MSHTKMILNGSDVTLIHQGGYLLCVESAYGPIDKLRLNREDLEQVETYLAGLLTADDLLIDIMRIICQLQNIGKVVSMNLRHKIQKDASNIDISVFDDHGSFEAWVYDDLPPPFSSFISFNNDNTQPLQTLRAKLIKMAEVNYEAK